MNLHVLVAEYQAVAQDHDQIINFGVYDNANEDMSYIQIALCISLLLESNSIDFISLGFNWGWGAELNLKEILRALFDEPFGVGYPRNMLREK